MKPLKCNSFSSCQQVTNQIINNKQQQQYRFRLADMINNKYSKDLANFSVNYFCLYLLKQCSTHIILFRALTKQLMNYTRYDSLKEVLPTIKRICGEQEDLRFSEGKTYLNNGLVLKHKITDFKIKSLVEIFARKMRRGLVNAPPVSFQLRSKKSKDDQRIIKLKGWDIQDRLEGFIMSLDIIMTVVTFFLGAFQGLLSDFRNSNIDATTAVLVIKVISIVVFTVRLILLMITVEYEDDKLYLYITDIVKKQLKGGLLLQIFSLVMVIVSLAITNNEWVGIVFFFSSFFKLALIKSNLKMLELRFVDSIKKFYMWNLIRIFIFNIIFAHIVASALLGASRINPDANWIQLKLVNNGFVEQQQTWFKVYIWTYYWACTIMMTVGFGDISPVDYRESIIVAFIQIFSSIVLAYNISEVGSIVSSMRKSSQQLQRKLGVLRRMAKKNPISQQLQCKIQSYLTHQIQIRDQFEYNEHRGIIDTLPQQLKQDYFSESNIQLYNSIPLFRYFQRDCLSKLNREFSGKVFYPGQYIIKFRAGNKNVIIMRSGEFGLCFWKQQSSMNGTIVQSISLEQNESKGALVTTNILSRDTQLNYDIISVTYSYGMQIDFQTFLTILKQSKLDYYYYRSVLDRHEKQRNPYEYASCEYCPKEYHTKFQCPKLHYVPIRSQKFIRYQTSNSREVERSFFIRKFQKFVKHCYLIRNILSEVEDQIAILHEDHYQELQVDQLYDYAMYFKDFNPQNLRKRRTRRRVSYYRGTSVSMTSKGFI